MFIFSLLPGQITMFPICKSGASVTVNSSVQLSSPLPVVWSYGGDDVTSNCEVTNPAYVGKVEFVDDCPYVDTNVRWFNLTIINWEEYPDRWTCTYLDDSKSTDPIGTLAACYGNYSY